MTIELVDVFISNGDFIGFVSLPEDISASVGYHPMNWEGSDRDSPVTAATEKAAVKLIHRLAD